MAVNNLLYPTYSGLPPQAMPPLTVPVAPAPGAAPLPGPGMRPPMQQGAGYLGPPVMLPPAGASAPPVMRGHGLHQQHGNPQMVPGVLRPPMGIIGGARYQGGFYG